MQQNTPDYYTIVCTIADKHNKVKLPWYLIIEDMIIEKAITAGMLSIDKLKEAWRRYNSLPGR